MITMQTHVNCPWCNAVSESQIDHLRDGVWTRWYCDECGRAYTLTRTTDGATVEKHCTWKKDVRCLLEYIHDRRLKIVARGMIFSGPDGETEPIEESISHLRFFFDEHNCPSNMLRPGDTVDTDFIFENDKDPHGIFEFVRILGDDEKI